MRAARFRLLGSAFGQRLVRASAVAVGVHAVAITAWLISLPSRYVLPEVDVGIGGTSDEIHTLGLVEAHGPVPGGPIAEDAEDEDDRQAAPRLERAKARPALPQPAVPASDDDDAIALTLEPPPARTPPLAPPPIKPPDLPVGPSTSAAAPPSPAGQPGRVVSIGVSGGDTAEHHAAGAEQARAGNEELASYLVELRDRVRGHWHPLDVYKRSGRRLDAERDPQLTTTLAIRLGRDGSLERLALHASSGVEALDQEAMGAFKRSLPLARLPGSALDPAGGFDFRFVFTLDETANSYIAKVGRAVAEAWRPSPAFRRFLAHDKIIVTRILLTPTGSLLAPTLQKSSGFDFLDRSVMEAIKAGTQFESPPKDLRPTAGMLALRVSFLFRIRGENRVVAVKDESTLATVQ